MQNVLHHTETSIPTYPMTSLDFTESTEDVLSVRLPKKIIQFMKSLKAFRSDMNFGSKIMEEYYKEITACFYRKVLRKCLLFLLLSLWWQLLIWAKVCGAQQTTRYEILKILAGFGAVLAAYYWTTAKRQYDTIRNLFLCMIIYMFLTILLHSQFICNYEFSIFSPVFEMFVLLMTISSIEFHVILPLFLGYILMTSSDLQLKVYSSFWAIQNTSFIKEVDKKVRNSIIYPQFMLIYSESFYTSSFVEQNRSIKFGYLIMASTCVLCCAYISYINKMRRRTSFVRLGQNVHARQIIFDVREERMKWIAAIMPSRIIPEYMKYVNSLNDTSKSSVMSVFLKSYNDVSILFAGIVGFAQITLDNPPNKVITLLNDIFNRFDDVCCKVGCEKLGTLGDCYYCVSGCPERRRDHAINCVELGLGMCHIMNEFTENITVRVGINTGRVNAAVIGRQRFRFDVYSYSVIIANEMESSGKPGRVHISEDTYEQVKHVFSVEAGDDYSIRVEKQMGIQGKVVAINNIKTYFVVDPGMRFQRLPKQDEQLIRKGKFTVLNYEKRKSISPNYRTNNPDYSYESDLHYLTCDSSKKGSALMRQGSTIHARSFNKPTSNSDIDLVFALRNDPEKQTKIFSTPMIHPITHSFTSTLKEISFRNHYFSPDISILSSTSTAPLFDCITCTIFHIIYSIGLMTFESPYSGIKMISTLITNIVNVIFCILTFIYTFLDDLTLRKRRLLYIRSINSYSMRNIHGFLTTNMPFFLLLFFYECEKSLTHVSSFRYTFQFYIGAYISFVPVFLFHSCSHIVHIVSSSMKLIVIVFLYIYDPPCSFDKSSRENITNCEHWTSKSSCSICEKIVFENAWFPNPSTTLMKVLAEMSMICVTSFIICRQNEHVFRLCYYVCSEAEIRRNEAEKHSKQADELLHNIIPKYVIDQIKRNKSYGNGATSIAYAFSVPQAAVAFVCISNFFSSYYREDYKGGESALALLHKIICLFDDMLLRRKYKDVEKIKTLGDCYVLASGLDVSSVDENLDEKAHLIALMDFCFEMISELDDFNDKWIVGTDKFTLKIGYNPGPLTAGVIGTSKLMFDIWGTTVNIASKLYHISEPGFIHVTKESVDLLKGRFTFNKSATHEMKGRGLVTTYTVDLMNPIEEFSHGGVRVRSYSRKSLIPGKISRRFSSFSPINEMGSSA